MACAQQAVEPEPPPQPAPARVYRVVGGSPVELLKAEDGHQLEFDTRSGQLSLDPPLQAVQDWRLDQPLGTCLGDPLSQPPAADIAGFRRLSLEDREGAWLISLSGANLCGLEGTVLLDLNSRRVDTNALRVQGLPWKEGGMTKARETLVKVLLPEGVEVP